MERAEAEELYVRNRSLPCSAVEDVTEVRAWIPAMLALCSHIEDDFVAGPQIGLAKQVFVTRIPGDMPRIFINPEIQKKHGIVMIRAFDLKGNQFIVVTDKGYFNGREDLGEQLAWSAIAAEALMLTTS
jgi:hypothetical protein